MSGIPDGLKGVMTYRLRTASLGHTVVSRPPPPPQVRTEPRALRLLSKRSTTQPPVVLLDL